jgi:transcriptional repressor of dcmA and dcmR
MGTKSISDNTFNDITAGESEPLLDIEQAARFLNVSETSLRRWTNDGRLACLRVGRRRERRFRRADLLAFMESEPAGQSRFGSVMVSHGTHLCGIYSSDEGQVRQALAFLSGGFRPGTVSYLVGADETRDRILAGLEREYPALRRDMEAGRLVVSDYAESAGAQLSWWEAQMLDAVGRGARLLRAVGDAGGFASAASREELLQYELEYGERIARRFPVVTMCQYDARRFSGLVILDALKAHPDCFRYPVERVLA